MALALEERSRTEILGRNDAIAALKQEVELLESEKAKLCTEVGQLADLHADVSSLRDAKEKAKGEVACLKKQVEDA
jgi:hypothetical protein